MPKTLDDFIKGGYEQLNFPEDGVANVQYLGQDIATTQWGDRVKIAVYDLIELKETAIYTTSGKLLRLLFKDLKVEVNDKVAIKRTGSGFDTKYEAKIISRAGQDKAETVTANEPKAPSQKEKPPAKIDPF